MPQLPKWTDAQSVATYITSILTFLLGIATTFHPGFHEPAMVQALVPSVSIIVAGVAQAVNIATHRAAHAKAARVPVPGPKGDPGSQGVQGVPGVAHEVDTEAIAHVVLRKLALSAQAPEAAAA